MVLHVCDVCGYQTTFKGNLVSHKKKKNPCKPKDETTTQSQVSDNNVLSDEEVNKNVEDKDKKDAPRETFDGSQSGGATARGGGIAPKTSERKKEEKICNNNVEKVRESDDRFSILTDQFREYKEEVEKKIKSSEELLEHFLEKFEKRYEDLHEFKYNTNVLNEENEVRLQRIEKKLERNSEDKMDMNERLNNVEEDCLRLKGEFEELEDKVEKKIEKKKKGN
jgi:chromosome segregation ATPase